MRRSPRSAATLSGRRHLAPLRAAPRLGRQRLPPHGARPARTPRRRGQRGDRRRSVFGCVCLGMRLAEPTRGRPARLFSRRADTGTVRSPCLVSARPAPAPSRGRATLPCVSSSWPRGRGRSAARASAGVAERGWRSAASPPPEALSGARRGGVACREGAPPSSTRGLARGVGARVCRDTDVRGLPGSGDWAAHHFRERSIRLQEEGRL